MPVHWQLLHKNVFLITADGDRPILYAPLQGVVMEVNAAYVDRFREALAGNKESAAALGLQPETLDRFLLTPPSAERRLRPVWPERFEPTSATVFLTNKCTLRCTYCYCHGGEGADMPWPVFERTVLFVLEHVKKRNAAFNLSFHGGDVGACWPLFRKCVAFIEEKCAEAGVAHALDIGTNGFYSDEQAAFVAQHIKYATVSIDGLPAIHDLHRPTPNGGPSLARILEVVRIFEHHNMDCCVRMTVTDGSVDRLSESVEYICQNTRSPLIRAEPLYSRGRAVVAGLKPPDSERFVEAFLAAQKVARKYGRELMYSGAHLDGINCSFCSFPAPTFGVTPEGNLTCCYEVLHPDDPLRHRFFYGYIPPDGSEVVVDAARVTAIRAWARDRREACTDCFSVFSCAGDCAAKVMDDGQVEGETPARCHITRSLIYHMLREVLSGDRMLRSSPCACAIKPERRPPKH